MQIAGKIVRSMKKINKGFKVMMLTLAILSFILISTNQTANAETLTWITDETDIIQQDVKTDITNLNGDLLMEYSLQPNVIIEVLNNYPDSYETIADYTDNRFNHLITETEELNYAVLIVMAIKDEKASVIQSENLKDIIRDAEIHDTIAYVEEHLEIYNGLGNNNPVYLNDLVRDTAAKVVMPLHLYETSGLDEYQSTIDKNNRDRTIENLAVTAVKIVKPVFLLVVRIGILVFIIWVVRRLILYIIEFNKWEKNWKAEEVIRKQERYQSIINSPEKQERLRQIFKYENIDEMHRQNDISKKKYRMK